MDVANFELHLPLPFYRNPSITRLLPCPLLSVATFQLQGIGRNYRPWLSPYGVLQFSLLLELPSHLEHLAENLDPFTHLFGMSVVEACRPFVSNTTIGPALKWPNDIYAKVNNRLEKIGGIVVNTIPPTTQFGPVKRILIGEGISPSIYTCLMP